MKAALESKSLIYLDLNEAVQGLQGLSEIKEVGSIKQINCGS